MPKSQFRVKPVLRSDLPSLLTGMMLRSRPRDDACIVGPRQHGIRPIACRTHSLPILQTQNPGQAATALSDLTLFLAYQKSKSVHKGNDIILYYILYYTILYYTILYFTILYYTLYSILYTILYTIYYILYTIYYILYTIYYTLYYILYTIYYILYTIYYTILYTIYSDSFWFSNLEKPIDMI